MPPKKSKTDGAPAGVGQPLPVPAPPNPLPTGLHQPLHASSAPQDLGPDPLDEMYPISDVRYDWRTPLPTRPKLCVLCYPEGHDNLGKGVYTMHQVDPNQEHILKWFDEPRPSRLLPMAMTLGLPWAFAEWDWPAEHKDKLNGLVSSMTIDCDVARLRRELGSVDSVTLSLIVKGPCLIFCYTGEDLLAQTFRLAAEYIDKHMSNLKLHPIAGSIEEVWDIVMSNRTVARSIAFKRYWEAFWREARPDRPIPQCPNHEEVAASFTERKWMRRFSFLGHVPQSRQGLHNLPAPSWS